MRSNAIILFFTSLGGVPGYSIAYKTEHAATRRLFANIVNVIENLDTIGLTERLDAVADRLCAFDDAAPLPVAVSPVTEQLAVPLGTVWQRDVELDVSWPPPPPLATPVATPPLDATGPPRVAFVVPPAEVPVAAAPDAPAAPAAAPDAPAAPAVAPDGVSVEVAAS